MLPYNLKDKLNQIYSLVHVRPTKQERRAFNASDRVLLTFDDFAEADRVHTILDSLKEYSVKAAFFLIGAWAEKNAELVEAIRKAGHWIGNHSYSHVRLTSLSSENVEKEIAEGVSGQLFRPPFGVYDDRIRKIAANLNYKIALWTVDSKDWSGISVHEIQERVFRELHPGACVLLHLNGPHTIEALPGLIQGIRRNGFELTYEGNEIDLLT